jgi:RNA polymerase sigma factor (sigma-70 family)
MTAALIAPVPATVPAAVPAPRRPALRLVGSPAGRPLLDALAAGDEGAWRETVRRYESLLRSRARAVLRTDSDVDEAVQRTWVLLLRNADRIADPARLPGWLATTARREALALVRQQQRETPSEEFGDAAPVEDGDLSQDLLAAELSEALDRAIDTLPESQRVIVRAMLRGAQSYDELSRELGMPRGSLGPLRGRAVKALRAQLVPAFA